MPKPDKKRSKLEESSNSDSTSDSDSGPDDIGPAKKATPAKKAAPAAKGGAAASSASKPKGNPAVEGQEPTWELGKMKSVKVREFKGRTFIDIREYYVDKNTMDTKPGRKGISLSCEQYQILKSVMPEIDKALP